MEPEFTEINKIGNSYDSRSRPPINFLLHTEEGGSSALSLAGYLNNSANQVSYHYTLRDAIVANVVDVDYASWSVLSANAFTINLCFAGSRAAWSRAQWLDRERDIEIAAYVAVRDCRRYDIPIRVIKPPYFRSAGISDHRYVTQVLGFGTHTDVGDGFPWDVFENYVAKWNGEEDMSWGEIINNMAGQPVSREDMIRYMDARLERIERLTIAVLDQLGGSGVGDAVAQGHPAKFDGFEQGGNRSSYDLQSAIAATVGVQGSRDAKGGK